jgi:hypothetical protein
MTCAIMRTLGQPTSGDCRQSQLPLVILSHVKAEDGNHASDSRF